VLTTEIKRRLDACRDVLVGKLPLPTDQIELITLALIYKFMDDLDGESVKLGGKRSFFVGPLEKYRWRALLPQTVSADERMNLFAEGIEMIGKAEHLPALFRDIFRNSFLKFRDGRILMLFLNEVNGFEYSHSEELGNAFEYLLKTMGIQAENGQFRTPRHIINFMVECLDPQPNDRILDPACGTGGFLVSAYKHILAQHTSPGSRTPGDKLTHDQRQKVYSNLTGYDVTDLMVKVSKVNLFLHGFPDPAIHIYDTLTNDARWNEKADLILANPPFMTPKGGVSPHTKFRVSAKKSEVLFTDYIGEHLMPDGRGAVIVPNGIVATTQNAYVKLRKFLIEDSLVAVVSLPAGVFKPYSGVKTSILFLDKKLSRKIDEVLFLKVNADGFDLGDQRRPIPENDLPEAKRVVKAWLDQQMTSEFNSALGWKAVEESAVRANNDVTLVVERFLGVPENDSEHHPMVRLGDEELFRLESGGTPSTEKSDYWNGAHAWATLVDLPPDDLVTNLTKTERTITDVGLKHSSAVLLPVGAVLVSTRATLGRVAVARIPVATNQGFKNIIIKDMARALPEYVALAVTRLRAQMLDFASGGTFKEISKRNFALLEIPLPPLEEQHRIVADVARCEQANVQLKEEITANRKRVQGIIESAWNETPNDG
jgi:type I restriction enzyme M protein